MREMHGISMTLPDTIGALEDGRSTDSKLRSVLRLRDCASKIGSGSTPKGGEKVYLSVGVPLIRSQNVLSGRLVLDDVARISADVNAQMSNSAVQEGDVLLNITGASIGRSCVVPTGVAIANVNQHVCIIRPNSKVDGDFLSQYLNSFYGQKQIWSFQGGGSREGLNFDQIGSFTIPNVKMSEQRKIAEILRTWDAALDKLSALHAGKEKRLTSLRHSLVFGTLRLEKRTSNWPLHRLSEVTYEISSRNGDMSLGRDLVMGVTNKRGIVPMREQTVAGDIARYKHLPPQAFAYNPMRINVGSIAKNEAAETVLVSPDYVVFGCNPDGIEPDYLDHLRKTAWWAHYINSGGSGSVRQRTYYADLAALRLPLPDIEEQRAIVAILNAAKADLSSTEGEWRV